MRSRMIALVFVVAAFAGLLGVFLVERERHTWALEDLERQVFNLESSLKSQEQRLTGVAAAEVSLRETEFERLRLWTEQSTAATQAHLLEKIVLLGFPMDEVAQAQGINLNTLSPLDSFAGYDQFYDGQHGYRLDWVDGDKALGERICHGIFGTIADMTGTSAEGLLAELGAIFNTDFVWQESESEGFCAYTGRTIAGERKISITIYTDENKAFTEESPLSIGLVEMLRPTEEMNTMEIVMEKAELLGLTMAEVAERQGVGLENLGEVDVDYYFDPKNQCYYSVDGDYGVPLGDQICRWYSQNFGDMFGGRSEMFLAEVKVFSKDPMLPHLTAQTYTFSTPHGKIFLLEINAPDGNGFVSPESQVSIGS